MCAGLPIISTIWKYPPDDRTARCPPALLHHCTLNGALIALASAPRLNKPHRPYGAGCTLCGSGRTGPAGTLGSSAHCNPLPGGIRQCVHGKDHSHRPFEENPLTSDKARFDRNAAIIAAHPHLAIGAPTARWLHETLMAGAMINEQSHLTKITIPTLILAPMLDGIVPYLHQERLSRNFRAGQLITITGARHEIFQERESIAARRWLRSRPSCPAWNRW